MMDLNVRRDTDGGIRGECPLQSIKGRIDGQREGHQKDEKTEDGRKPKSDSQEPISETANVLLSNLKNILN